MAIKWTLQGLLVYVAMAEYLLAFAAFLAGTKKLAWGQFAAGFMMTLAAVVYRGLSVQHVPLQGLFEVFCVLGMLAFPLSVFARRFLRVGYEAADALIGAVVLFPAGFVFSATAHPLPPALQSPLFEPHVAAYLIAYMVLAKAAVAAGDALVRPGELRSREAMGRLVGLAFPLLTAGLVLGAVWGKLAWGDWWNWDPKELWALATWLVYGVYFHVRALRPPSAGRRWNRAEAAIVLAGFAFVAITLLWANLSRLFAGLHTYAT